MVILSISVSSRIKNNNSHTFQYSGGYQSDLSVLLNERLHNTLVALICKTSVAYSDVPLLFFFFKQHMIPTATTSITQTAAMTPMMMAKVEIQNNYNIYSTELMPI